MANTSTIKNLFNFHKQGKKIQVVQVHDANIEYLIQSDAKLVLRFFSFVGSSLKFELFCLSFWVLSRVVLYNSHIALSLLVNKLHFVLTQHIGLSACAMAVSLRLKLNTIAEDRIFHKSVTNFGIRF